MKNLFSILILSFIAGLFNGSCTSQAQFQKNNNGIITGAEQTDAYFELLEGKNIGLVVNKTSTIGSTHLVDTLFASKFNIKKIFAPEHGYRGNKGAGEIVNDEIDSKTGIPVVSLYGKSKKPTVEQLKGINLMVFDIQDVGARFYTYISTMHYIMQTCAENNIPLIVLDRPNPNGDYVDGPVLDTAFRSFVGMHPIPIVHGLTVGELALMINGEGWLENGLKCKLMVVKLKNYTHQTSYILPIAPSPNLSDSLSIRLYPSLCLFEGTSISVARGTKFPFKAIGYPNEGFGSFAFAPLSIPGVADKPLHMNKICYGTDLRSVTSPIKGFDLRYLIEYRNKFTDFKQFMLYHDFFNLLAGNNILQQQLEQNLPEEAIRRSWEPKLSAYKALRKKYLLYSE